MVPTQDFALFATPLGAAPSLDYLPAGVVAVVVAAFAVALALSARRRDAE